MPFASTEITAVSVMFKGYWHLFLGIILLYSSLPLRMWIPWLNYKRLASHGTSFNLISSHWRNNSGSGTEQMGINMTSRRMNENKKMQPMVSNFSKNLWRHFTHAAWWEAYAGSHSYRCHSSPKWLSWWNLSSTCGKGADKIAENPNRSRFQISTVIESLSPFRQGDLSCCACFETAAIGVLRSCPRSVMIGMQSPQLSRCPSAGGQWEQGRLCAVFWRACKTVTEWRASPIRCPQAWGNGTARLFI